MREKIFQKIKSNFRIYKRDIKSKGLYYSIIHRLYKIPYLKTLLLPIVNFLKPDYILIENQKLYIDKFDTTISERLVLSKKWEDYETRLFKKAISKGDVVLDIGAHIGYYTLIASKLVGKDGLIFAFEPDYKNFKLLKKNVKKNNRTNVLLVNKAVTDRKGKIKLYLNKQNTGDHRIYDSKDGRERVTVGTIRLDEFFKKFKKEVNLIKMDIQGAEYKTLKGGLNLLRNNPNIKIFTEFWPMGLRLNQDSAIKFLNLLTRFKFKLYQINEKSKKLTLTSADYLLNQYPANNADYTNLYCVKNKK